MFRFGAREKSHAPFLCIFRFSPHRDRRKDKRAPKGSKMNANHAQNDFGCNRSGSSIRRDALWERLNFPR